MTRQEQMAEAIEQIPVDPSFKELKGFPVPLRDKIIIKKIVGAESENRVTEGGIIIPTTIANNTVIPDIGIIYAVGTEVTEMLRPGLKVMYNPFADLQIMIKGESYLRMDERDIYLILTPSDFAIASHKSDRQVFREIRKGEDAAYRKRLKEHNDNETDKKESLTKKK